MSDDAISLPEFAAHFAVKLFEPIIAKVGAAASAAVSSHFNDFDMYLRNTHGRCGYVKLILNRDTKVEIEKLYIPGKFKGPSGNLSDTEICQMARDGARLVIQGNGGTGKSMLLRHTWVQLFKEPAGKIPIYVELRKLNDLSSADLSMYIRGLLSPSGSLLTDDAFRNLLSNGRFTFLFDGMDEVAERLKQTLKRQILDFASQYPDCGFLVSGRYDASFGSWEQFVIVRALPFDQKMVEQQIRRIPFSESTKKKFISDVIRKDFKSYDSFLSTPLLASIMLKTYAELADLPKKIHVFYEKAFETMYYLHDSGKELFHRDRPSGLSQDDFERIFAAFSFLSYRNDKLNFHYKELVTYIERAAEQCGIDVDEKLLIREICHSVNLMFEDDGQFQFTHKNFQEYFAATCVARHFPGRMQELLHGLTGSAQNGLIGLIYGISPSAVQDLYLVPVYEKNQSDLNDLVELKDDPEMAGAYLGLTIAIFGDLSNSANAQVGASIYCRSDLARYLNCTNAALPSLGVASVKAPNETVFVAAGVTALRAACRAVGSTDVLIKFCEVRLDSGHVTAITGSGREYLGLLTPVDLEKLAADFRASIKKVIVGHALIAATVIATMEDLIRGQSPSKVDRLSLF